LEAHVCVSHLLGLVVVPVFISGVYEHLSLALLQAYGSLLAEVHDVIKAHVP